MNKPEDDIVPIKIGDGLIRPGLDRFIGRALAPGLPAVAHNVGERHSSVGLAVKTQAEPSKERIALNEFLEGHLTGTMSLDGKYTEYPDPQDINKVIGGKASISAAAWTDPGCWMNSPYHDQSAARNESAGPSIAASTQKSVLVINDHLELITSTSRWSPNMVEMHQLRARCDIKIKLPGVTYHVRAGTLGGYVTKDVRFVDEPSWVQSDSTVTHSTISGSMVQNTSTVKNSLVRSSNLSNAVIDTSVLCDVSPESALQNAPQSRVFDSKISGVILGSGADLSNVQFSGIFIPRMKFGPRDPHIVVSLPPCIVDLCVPSNGPVQRSIIVGTNAVNGMQAIYLPLQNEPGFLGSLSVIEAKVPFKSNSQRRMVVEFLMAVSTACVSLGEQPKFHASTAR